VTPEDLTNEFVVGLSLLFRLAMEQESATQAHHGELELAHGRFPSARVVQLSHLLPALSHLWHPTPLFQ
jgi:hypothetical protein